MSLTNAQSATLAAHIRANTDPVVVSALAARRDDDIRDWYNTDSATDVWDVNITRLRLMEETNIGQFDNLTAGKREAWKLMLDQAGLAPLDMGRQRMRNNVRDIWATAQADAILTACIRKGTRGELVFGGNVETSGTLSATDLTVEITLTTSDISRALNEF